MNKKILFASDIDNTLIHSYKTKKEHDICIEQINDQMQAFMSPKTFEMFSEMTRISTFLPVTSRSFEQYQRIIWPNGFIPSMALIANGANLVCRKQVRRFLPNNEQSTCMLERLYTQYRLDSRLRACRIVDDAYFYLHIADGVDLQALQNEVEMQYDLQVVRIGTKIYCLPKGINKGEALQKFRMRHKFDVVYVAGDSFLDLSMLRVADIALIPQDFPWSDQIQTTVRQNRTMAFSDFVLQQILSDNS